MQYSPESWEIPKEIMDETTRALSHQHEVFVLWTAKRSEVVPRCRICRIVIPRQIPESSILGVSVRIDGDELARIVYDNYTRGEKSVVQLHTHPGRSVVMSGLDHEREVVRHPGALSIIVPWYARDGLPSVRRTDPGSSRVMTHLSRTSIS